MQGYVDFPEKTVDPKDFILNIASSTANCVEKKQFYCYQVAFSSIAI